MKAQRDQQGWTVVSLRFWSYPDAVKAVPYIRSVVSCLRESWIELRQARRRLERLETRPGRPDRNALLLREDLTKEIDRAGERCREAINDLMTLDVYSVDPAGGIALIPFAHHGQLAWFVFDLFAAQPIDSWQLLGDPLSTRRSLIAVAPMIAPTR
jgi:hypothetical protein